MMEGRPAVRVRERAQDVKLSPGNQPTVTLSAVKALLVRAATTEEKER
jgi:hypothetical protein